MRDEALAIRREISLERGNDRRQQAANALSHGFSATNEYRRNRHIKSADGRIRRGEHRTSNVRLHNSSFFLLPCVILPPSFIIFSLPLRLRRFSSEKVSAKVTLQNGTFRIRRWGNERLQLCGSCSV